MPGLAWPCKSWECQAITKFFIESRQARQSTINQRTGSRKYKNKTKKSDESRSHITSATLIIFFMSVHVVQRLRRSIFLRICSITLTAFHRIFLGQYRTSHLWNASHRGCSVRQGRQAGRGEHTKKDNNKSLWNGGIVRWCLFFFVVLFHH